MGIKWSYTTSKEKAEAELKSENRRLAAQAKTLRELVEAAEKVVNWDIGADWQIQFDAITMLKFALARAKEVADE